MKTTNFEISKKLKEIGFKADYDFVWCEHKKTKDVVMLSSDFDCHDYGYSYNTLARSYDLETLLDSLKSKGYIQINITFTHAIFNFEGGKVIVFLQESLADMAGRLIIKLHEKGLIRFGGENE